MGSSQIHFRAEFTTDDDGKTQECKKQIEDMGRVVYHYHNIAKLVLGNIWIILTLACICISNIR